MVLSGEGADEIFGGALAVGCHETFGARVAVNWGWANQCLGFDPTPKSRAPQATNSCT